MTRRGQWGACWVVLMAACTPMPPSHTYENTTRGAAVSIALVASGENAVSSAVTRAFLRNVEFSVNEFIIKDSDSVGSVVDGVRASKPSLVVALGGRAAVVAHARLTEFPLLFGLVQEDESSDLSGENTAGVSLRLSPSTEFSLYRLVSADLKRVATFYTPQHTEQWVSHVQAEVRTLGVELTTLPVKKPADVPEAYKQLPKDVQAVWLFNDSNLMARENFRFLRAQTQQAHQLLLGSALREFAAAGATMAVAINFSNLGGQLAAMANTALSGAPFSTLGVRPPIGGRLVVNMDSANQLGLDIPERAQPFLSEVIASDPVAARP